MAHPRKHGTTSEAEIRALVDQGLNFPQIAEKLNLNTCDLRITASVLGIQSAIRRGIYGAGRNTRTQEELQSWVRQLEVGKSLGDIAKATGITRQAVHQIMAKNGLPTSIVAAVRAKAAIEAKD